MLVLRYIVFAMIAIAVNLLVQFAVIQLVDFEAELFLAMAAGTVAGLLCKYELDRLWIFSDAEQTFQRDSGQFAKYSVFGLLTTGIFWGVELAFDFFFSHPSAKYIGGAIGLTIGYIIKYQLDKHFVFKHKGEPA